MRRISERTHYIFKHGERNLMDELDNIFN